VPLPTWAHLVAPPAEGLPGLGQRTGVLGSRRDGRDAAPEASHRSRQRVRGGGTVAELAGVVVAPAPDAARGGQRAREAVSHRYRNGLGQPEDVDRRVSIRRGAVAELAIAVVTPALHGAALGDGAAARPARRCRDHALGGRRRRGGAEPERDHGRRSEPTALARSDTNERRREQDRPRSAERGHLRRRRALEAGHRHGCRAVQQSTVVELAAQIAAPALHGTRGHDGAGKPGEQKDVADTS
jgi:hypothetical protein